MMRSLLLLARATQLWVLDGQADAQDNWKVWLMNHKHGRFETIKSWILILNMKCSSFAIFVAKARPTRLDYRARATHN
jgi:hypothetical protein